VAICENFFILRTEQREGAHPAGGSGSQRRRCSGRREARARLGTARGNQGELEGGAHRRGRRRGGRQSRSQRGGGFRFQERWRRCSTLRRVAARLEGEQGCARGAAVGLASPFMGPRAGRHARGGGAAQATVGLWPVAGWAPPGQAAGPARAGWAGAGRAHGLGPGRKG
jgi:hypothetical protein